ncbi:MAG: SagB family peptide dehydrogenase [Myxococcales bacterium]|nr:SagB family peptide dehydrogenase [Myxococcales bacterium]
MKLWVAATPLALLAVWAGTRALQKRLDRRSAKIAVALTLLVYVLTTALLGVFWVARMDLPVFDWHYLFGYGLLLALALHLALELESVVAHLRRSSPALLLDAAGRRFRAPIRVAASLGLLLVVSAPIAAWLLGRALPSKRVRIGVARAPTGSARTVLEDSPSVWIERGGVRLGVPDYLYAESSHTRAGVLRRPSVPPARPAPVRDGSARAFLPPPALAPSSPDAGARVVVGGDLERVSTLLHHTWGVTRRSSDGLMLRAAASAGALFPVDVFLTAPKGGASPGVHYYDPEAHALARTGDADAAERFLSALPADSPVRDAELVIALGATFDRTVFKYDVRAYRYIGLDAGHVALNLLRAGSALGLPCVLEPWFDDAASAAAVGLAGEGEGVLLVAGCGGRAVRAPRERPAHSPLAVPELVDAVELSRLSHRLTSWRLEPGGGAAWDAGIAPGRPTHPDPLALIRERRSVRAFSDRGVSRADLDAALAAARGAIHELGLPALVELFVTARAVTDLPPGSYRVRDELDLVSRDPSVAERLERAGLDQEVLGRAAFVIAFGLSPRAGRVDGARDFRHALLQGGLAGEAVYLEAAARGLGACSVGAFFDEELGDVLGGGGARPLHLVAIGHR